jgi:Calcineurin-like phosphoesterase
MLRTVRGWLVAAVVVVAAAVAVAVFVLGDGDSPKGTGRVSDGPQRASTSPQRSTYLGPGEDRGWMASRAKPRSVVWAVGDAADGTAAAREVASMVTSRRVDRLLYLGDVYETGTAEEFRANYRPLYGRLGAVTAPTIGNHEWANIAAGYVPYWTAVRGTPPPLRYTFAASGWQLISINSNQPTDAGQEEWLDREIRRTARYGNCRIAFMHHPRYSAGLHGDLDALEGVFDELRGHARILLAGHDHDMQRLHPTEGITQYVIGAGGAQLFPTNRDDPRLAFFEDSQHGALRLALRPGRAALSFIAADGSLLDRSVVSCNQY